MIVWVIQQQEISQPV